jgi:hypothetical protein
MQVTLPTTTIVVISGPKDSFVIIADIGKRAQEGSGKWLDSGQDRFSAGAP